MKTIYRHNKPFVRFCDFCFRSNILFRRKKKVIDLQRPNENCHEFIYLFWTHSRQRRRHHITSRAEWARERARRTKPNRPIKCFTFLRCPHKMTIGQSLLSSISSFFLFSSVDLVCNRNGFHFVNVCHLTQCTVDHPVMLCVCGDGGGGGGDSWTKPVSMRLKCGGA